MENDSIYKRININSIMKIVREKNPDMDDFEIKTLSYETIAELNKKINEVVLEFERGEGFFDSCYFCAKDNLNL